MMVVRADELLVWLVEEDGIVGLFLGWLENAGILRELECWFSCGLTGIVGGVI